MSDETMVRLGDVIAWLREREAAVDRGCPGGPARAMALDRLAWTLENEPPEWAQASAHPASALQSSPWADQRRHVELEQLSLLLHEVCTINRGSHCLERIARCIELAEGLSREDWTAGRRSFLGFLRDMAASYVRAAAAAQPLPEPPDA